MLCNHHVVTDVVFNWQFFFLLPDCRNPPPEKADFFFSGIGRSTTGWQPITNETRSRAITTKNRSRYINSLIVSRECAPMNVKRFFFPPRRRVIIYLFTFGGFFPITFRPANGSVRHFFAVRPVPADR